MVAKIPMKICKMYDKMKDGRIILTNLDEYYVRHLNIITSLDVFDIFFSMSIVE